MGAKSQSSLQHLGSYCSEEKELHVVFVGPPVEVLAGVSTYTSNVLSGTLATRFKFHHVRVGPSGWPGRRALLEMCILMHRHRKQALVHLNPSLDWNSIVRDAILLGIAKYFRVPVMIQVHGGQVDWMPGISLAASRHLLSRFFASVDEVIVLSRNQYQGLASVIGEQKGKHLTVVPAVFVPILPLQREVRHKLQPCEFLYLGRVELEKGVFELIDAYEQILKRVPDARLTVVGPGAARQHLSRRASELGLSVQFMDSVRGKEKQNILGRADVFVLPSWSEGCSIALLEAMAAGLAAICTTVGAAPDILRQGEHALLVPPKNVPCLAEAMLLLATDTDLRARIAAAGHELVKTGFSLIQQDEFLGRFYEALVTDGNQLCK